MTTAFLAFQLAGPLASWGDVTVGDVRSTWPAPSASALIGLLAAAHGIRRDDTEGQTRLEAFRFAVRVDRQGTPERDYHTVQSARAEKKPFVSRTEELSHGKIGTKLTDRSYISGQTCTVVAWGGDVDGAQRALLRPRFFLCLGRRACPLSRPPASVVIEAASVVDAFRAFDGRRPSDAILPEGEDKRIVYWDARPGGPPAGLDEVMMVERRDIPVTRSPDWSFRVRPVASAPWPEG